MTLLMVLFSAITIAQIQVSGVVEDTDGEPLPEAYVESESGKTVETDINGRYTITASQGEELTFSFIGMNDVVKIVSGNSLNVTMGIDEGNVIGVTTVIGYGIKMEEYEKAGAIVTVDSEVFEQTPNVSIDQALQGEVPGLNLSTNGGQPGATNTVILRGLGTLSGDSNPLYVLDGVILGRGEANAQLVTTFNPLTSIDPNNIKNVTVLKDAIATSVYGSQGANGVIIIETKTGRKNQKTRFSLKSETSFTDIAYDEAEVYNAEGFVNLSVQGLLNAGTFSDEDVARATASGTLGWNGTTDTNWEDVVMRSKGAIFSNNFSMTGGSEKSTFSANVSAYQNKPLAKENQFDRITGAFRFNHDATDKLNLDMNTQISSIHTETPSDGSSFSNPFFAKYTALPTNPVFNEDGSYNTALSGILRTSNPLGNLEQNEVIGDQLRLVGAFKADYQINDFLSFDTQLSGDYQSFNEKLYWNPEFGDGFSAGRNGFAASGDLNDFQWSWTNFVRFNKTFSEKNSLKIDVGIENIEQKIKIKYLEAQNFAGSLTELGAAATKNDAKTDTSERAQVSYISRLTYSYDKRYVINGFFRREGNSKLAEKWTNFWGVGATWNIDNEAFFNKEGALSALMLRVNYGEVGNDPISKHVEFYGALRTVGVGYNYGDSPGIAFDNLGNDEMKWERTKQWNFGLDYGFFNDRITGTVDYYIKQGEDLFIDSPLNPSDGFSNLTDTSGNSQLANAADIKNSGVEVLLKGRIFKGDGFNWTSTGTFSYNKNEVTKLPENEDIRSGNKVLRIGESAGVFYDFGYAGVDRNTGEALFYTDGTKSATTSDINDAERFLHGNSIPSYTASWKNDFSYKGIYLNAMFNYVGDFQVWDRWAFVYDGDGAFSTTNHIVRDRWTPENPDAKYPQYVWNNRSNSNNGSRYIYDGDYIRLKDLRVGYRFQLNALEQIGLEALELYVRGTNLWTYTFDDDLYFDPESTSNAYSSKWKGTGVYDLTSPLMKTYSFGVVVGF